MTVSAASPESTFLGNGVNTTFTFAWPGVSTSYINVYFVDSSGTQTLLPSTDYLITLNSPAAGQIWGIGGTVNYPLAGSPISSGQQLLVQRVVPYAQQTNVANQTAYPVSVQTALDTLCFEIQQLVARTGQYRGVWATGVFYNYGDVVVDGLNGTDTNNIYMCINSNTSSVWSTDLAAGDWALAVNVQSIVNSLPAINNNNIFGNISGAPATPTGITLTALLDKVISSTQGALIYRDSGQWNGLAPGTNGQVLTSGGPAANPGWQTSAGSGTITGVTAGTGLVGGGSSGSVSLAFATVANNSLLANITGGSAVPSATTLSALIDAIISSTQGAILYRNASSWVALTPGTSGQVLTTAGAAANPSWSSTGSSLTLLSTVNASAAASVVFNSTFITNTYRKYIVEIDSYYSPSLGGSAGCITMDISTNNGSSYITTNYTGNVIGTNGTSYSGGSTSGFVLPGATTGTANTASNGGSTNTAQFHVEFSNPSASQQIAVTWDGTVYTGATYFGGGINNSTTAINAIRFRSFLTNISTAETTTGTFKLYGLS